MKRLLLSITLLLASPAGAQEEDIPPTLTTDTPCCWALPSGAASLPPGGSCYIKYGGDGPWLCGHAGFRRDRTTGHEPRWEAPCPLPGIQTCSVKRVFIAGSTATLPVSEPAAKVRVRGIVEVAHRPDSPIHSDFQLWVYDGGFETSNCNTPNTPPAVDLCAQ